MAPEGNESRDWAALSLVESHMCVRVCGRGICMGKLIAVQAALTVNYTLFLCLGSRSKRLVSLFLIG